MRLGRDILGLDLYRVLGVGKAATAGEIRARYLDGVRASHPDLNPDDAEASARTARLNVAAKVLLDPALRRAYDHARAGPRAEAAASRAWYEQRPERRRANPSDDWVFVKVERKPASKAAGKFLRELRGRLSRVSQALDERLTAMPRKARLAATTALLAAAFWLIASARPRNLMADPVTEPQPTSVNPALLSP